MDNRLTTNIPVEAQKPSISGDITRIDGRWFVAVEVDGDKVLSGYWPGEPVTDQKVAG